MMSHLSTHSCVIMHEICYIVTDISQGQPLGLARLRDLQPLTHTRPRAHVETSHASWFSASSLFCQRVSRRSVFFGGGEGQTPRAGDLTGMTLHIIVYNICIKYGWYSAILRRRVFSFWLRREEELVKKAQASDIAGVAAACVSTRAPAGPPPSEVERRCGGPKALSKWLKLRLVWRWLNSYYYNDDDDDGQIPTQLRTRGY